jgi:hypothetical protein
VDYVRVYKRTGPATAITAEGPQLASSLVPRFSNGRISINAAPEVTYTLELADMAGRVLMRYSGAGPWSTAAAHLAPGVYLYKVKRGTAVQTGALTCRP